ncbi:hypothetical protein [Desmospora profundinema]|uniref:Uncharacterized protein n=1 Tax=Desmospora profundinema TaxID=1571184 RepID=A0ABU1IKW4_9BACL|nr:hypothetical protein [Desmospora profundinema]MDR6225421.1 hypothetical protein [Desmospora profundinema]
MDKLELSKRKLINTMKIGQDQSEINSLSDEFSSLVKESIFLSNQSSNRADIYFYYNHTVSDLYIDLDIEISKDLPIITLQLEGSDTIGDTEEWVRFFICLLEEYKQTPFKLICQAQDEELLSELNNKGVDFDIYHKYLGIPMASIQHSGPLSLEVAISSIHHSGTDHFPNLLALHTKDLLLVEESCKSNIYPTITYQSDFEHPVINFEDGGFEARLIGRSLTLSTIIEKISTINYSIGELGLYVKTENGTVGRSLSFAGS